MDNDQIDEIIETWDKYNENAEYWVTLYFAPNQNQENLQAFFDSFESYTAYEYDDLAGIATICADSLFDASDKAQELAAKYGIKITDLFVD